MRGLRSLAPELQQAGAAAAVLALTVLLPWYEKSFFVLSGRRPVSATASLSALQVFSFVEAAVLLVALGVLFLVWARGQRKGFHLPGGDGTVIMGAGLWVMFLIFFRQLDKPNGRKEGLIQTSIGVQWGIFIAFLLGALLAYAGYRIRAAHVPEPTSDEAPPEPDETARTRVRTRPQPDAEEPPPDKQDDDSPTVVARRRRPPSDDPFDGQLSFDEPAEYRPPPRRR